MQSTNQLRPQDAEILKMRRHELESLLDKSHGSLQMDKCKWPYPIEYAGGYEFYYYTRPSTYETVKHVVGVWVRGTAYIRKSSLPKEETNEVSAIEENPKKSRIK